MTAAEILLELRGTKMEATIFSRFKQELLKQLGINQKDACGVMTLVPYIAEAFCRRFYWYKIPYDYTLLITTFYCFIYYPS